MTIPATATPRPSRILTLTPEAATGLRRFIARWAMRRMGGVLPGIGRILLVDLRVGLPAGILYAYLYGRRSSPLPAYGWLILVGALALRRSRSANG